MSVRTKTPGVKSKRRPQAKAARKDILPGGFAPSATGAALRLLAEPIGRLIEFKAMSTAKHRLALIASVFAILGLLYAPVCALRY